MRWLNKGREDWFSPPTKLRIRGGSSRSFLPFFILFAIVVSVSSSLAQHHPEPEEARLEFKEACWFDDELSTALVFVDAIEQPVVILPESDSEIRFFNWSVESLENDDRGNFVALVQFMPRRSGVRSFPSIRLDSDDRVWATKPRQIVVGEAHQTPEMKFTIAAPKTRVYVGEPIRLDFVWSCRLPLGQLRAFRLSPEFFNDASISIAIPRSQAPEEEQFGMPVGGRRVIATRKESSDTEAGLMGEARFSIFVQFDEPGQFELPATRLLCSRMLNPNSQSNQYAAYFNNGLFESPDRSAQYEKIEAFSEAMRFEVVALPERGREESFSGLFAPEAIEVTAHPDTQEVGQLMEVRVDVISATASEMLSLGRLDRQASLRNRFWVGQEVNELWRPDGRTFTLRARPLTVEASFFPSLSFQVFNPDVGDYETLRTDLIPLTVKPRDGKNYFDMGSIPGAVYSIAESPEGVWHNEKATIMNEAINGAIGALSDGMWIFIVGGAIGFAFLLPRVREWRRRSLDTDYRRRKLAYGRFRRTLAASGDPVEALRSLIADCYARTESALTASDAANLLRSSKGEDSLVRDVENALSEADHAPYYPDPKEASIPDHIGALGKRIFALLGKAALVLLLILVSFERDGSAEAADWTQAEASFEAALALASSSGDSEAIEGKFGEAALQFEACGKEGLRPGLAWYNAGNAWFKAGEVGRAIASYRQAQSFRPLDERLAESLTAARALRVDSLPEAEGNRPWPLRWRKALFSFSWLSLAAVGLLWFRYRSLSWRIATAGVGLWVAALGVDLAKETASGLSAGVLIVDEAYGRKGPSYAYSSAFLDPLHNGMEMTILEERADWVWARLEEGSECWLPGDAVQRLLP